MKRLFCIAAFFLCIEMLAQSRDSVYQDQTRFYKAENLTSATYLKLAKNGTYRVVHREHMGVAVTEQGHWERRGIGITFRPSTVMQGGKMVGTKGKFYKATEVKYKGKTFIAFTSEDAAGVVIPPDQTKKELDSDPRSIPSLVFFKTSAKVYAKETKEAYPFHYIGSEP